MSKNSRKYIPLEDLLLQYSPSNKNMNWGHVFKYIVEKENVNYEKFLTILKNVERFDSPIVLDKETKQVVDGHFRITAAYMHNLKSLQFIYSTEATYVTDPDDECVTVYIKGTFTSDELDALTNALETLEIYPNHFITVFLPHISVKVNGDTEITLFYDSEDLTVCDVTHKVVQEVINDVIKNKTCIDTVDTYLSDPYVFLIEE